MLLMSNNLWNRDTNSEAWAAMGEDCSADARVDGLVQAYFEVIPDILGFQEMSDHMAVILMERLRKKEAEGGPVYSYISGGYTPIIYRKDKLNLLESGYFCYPEKMDAFEGEFNDVRSKSYCFGVFEEKETGVRLAYMTTHLWWKSIDPKSKSYQPYSDEARAYQIGLACDRMEEIMVKYGCPGFIVGDYNDTMTSPCLQTALAKGWTEVHDLAVGDCDDTEGHHYCFPDGYCRGERGKFADAIDHMMIKNGANVKIHHFRRIDPEYFDKLSDHYPLYIDCSFS